MGQMWPVAIIMMLQFVHSFVLALNSTPEKKRQLFKRSSARYNE